MSDAIPLAATALLPLIAFPLLDIRDLNKPRRPTPIRKSGSGPSAAIHDPIDQGDQQTATNDVSRGDRNEIDDQPAKTNPGFRRRQHRHGNEVHVCDAMFEPESDECRDREQNDEDLAGNAVGAEAHPHREAHQCIAKYAAKKGVDRNQANFS